MQNPFSYTFGIKPREYIANEQEDVILNDFMYKPTERAYMITGVRGSGKTVMLSDITESLEKTGDWYVIDLNPARDLMQSLAAQLYDHQTIRNDMVSAKVDFSFFGIGVELEGGEKITDIESVIGKMLDKAATHNKKILVTIDEATSSDNMQVFCLAFQKYIRKRLPIYIVMTGLYNKIHNIKNMKDCTFLQRAPYITLEPLDISAIALRYKKVFDIEKKTADELAKMTKGYAFAFQVLGKLYFDNRDKEPFEDIEMEYESELIRYSYRKIWSELSKKDKEFVVAMVELNRDGEVAKSDLMAKTGEGSAMINRYQSRLKEQGIIRSPQFGTYQLALPEFADFVQDYYIG